MDDPLDHDRLSDVTLRRRARLRPPAHPDPGRRLAAWALAGLVAALAGCSTPGPAPFRSPGLPLPPVASFEAGGSTPLPADIGSAAVDLDAVTLVCESWGSEPPAGTIPCRDAAGLGLAALGAGRAARVVRLDVAFGEGCAATPDCPNRRPDVGWVVARAAGGGDALLVRVARVDSGELRVWPPVAGAPPPTPAFDPPARTAPDLGPDAPNALRDREPLPFCGDEDLGQSESFDVTARRCFVDGVIAGAQVELISRASSTEGDPVLTVFRFDGRGSVSRSVRSAGQWTTAVCGISPVATPAAFVTAGGCDAGGA